MPKFYADKFNMHKGLKLKPRTIIIPMEQIKLKHTETKTHILSLRCAACNILSLRCGVYTVYATATIQERQHVKTPQG